MTKDTHFPPPSRPDARFDAIVDRGRSIRRRDRMRRALVTAGTVALVLLVIGVGVIGATRGERRVDPVTPPTTAPSTEMEVTATAEHDAVVVDVDDPRAAAGDRTGACVLVRIQPEEPARVATSEAYACWNPTLGSAATVVAMSPATAEVGCATTLERDPADDGSPTTEASGNGPSGNVPGTAAPPSGPTGELHHTFRFTLPTGLPAGTYVAEVQGSTGPGEPCPTAVLPAGAHRASHSTAVEVP
ncbi:MAG TPA: hypothetical protein PKX97_04520 [Microthrixaceae bacterium]|nr:hypothetical protein [Microthrixaceae bacterium]